MPITKKDAPDVLPDAAKKIYVGAFNGAFDDTCKDRNDRDACAAKIAWSAVKKKYSKRDDKWVPKAALVDVQLVITKASLLANGTMRWQATASDTDQDRWGERTSLALFRDWVERIETGKSASFLPPARVPFLGLSHYPSMDGSAEAGITGKMYLDGKQFKASGEFQPGPLGKALFEAVRAELDLVKRGQTVEQPIRISAAWWDLEHSHGNFVFTRRSLTDICHMCAQGAGDKVYLKGQLDHFAATRVPINPRTKLELEEKSMPKVRRRDDAASIVGDELADELEQKAQKLVGKSQADESPEALVVKAKPDVEKAVTKTIDGEEYTSGDFLVVKDPREASTWHLQVKKGGKPDHQLMAAAWAALYRESGDKEAIGNLKALYKSEEMNLPTKADVEKFYDEQPALVYSPFGGATSMEEAEAYLETQEMVDEFYTQWDMFNAVICNILNMHPQEGELESDLNQRKLEAVREVAAEFNKSVSAVKANVTDGYLIQPAPRTEAGSLTPHSEAGPIRSNIVTEQANPEAQTAPGPEAPGNGNAPVSVLGTAVKAALDDATLSREAKVESIQAALNSYAEAVKAELDTVAPPAPGEQIATAIEKSLGGFADKLDLLLAKLDQRVVQTPLGGQADPAQLPQQKSFVPKGAIVPQQSNQQLPVSPITGQPSNLRAMIERSVGIHQ